jgi:glycosyltransferase involved in cell wall biosynthesis
MTISIITPSFRSSQWLRLCVASVADQQGVSVEHIVQDSCSDDETPNWLPRDPRVKAFIEKDKGMYDAVNRGFRRANGDILAYLNCDEQFLPGALKQVEEFFAAHPAVDVVLADTIIADSEGNYICHRPSLVPGKHQIWIRFPVLSSSLFLRRRVVHDMGIFLDTQWRDLGDIFWVMAMVQRGVRMAVLPQFTSLFTDTGENMNLRPNAIRERQMKWEMTPGWVKRLKIPIIFYNRLRLALRRPRFQGPFDYSIYTLSSPQQRVTRQVAKPTTIWKGRVNQWSDSEAVKAHPAGS